MNATWENRPTNLPYTFHQRNAHSLISIQRHDVGRRFRSSFEQTKNSFCAHSRAQDPIERTWRSSALYVTWSTPLIIHCRSQTKRSERVIDQHIPWPDRVGQDCATSWCNHLFEDFQVILLKNLCATDQRIVCDVDVDSLTLEPSLDLTGVRLFVVRKTFAMRLKSTVPSVSHPT